MSTKLREQVRQRSHQRCEYCQMPEELDMLVFHSDHIVAQKHRGMTILSNLAWSCFSCNNQKQSDLSGVDPEGKPDEIVRLYNPRQDEWADHYEWLGAELAGRTPIGRVTLYVLGINLPHRVALRQMLIDEGVFPTGL